MWTAYTEPAELAKALAPLWARRGHRAYPRPYNIWQWDQSRTWWIVPVPERPTFKYSKIIISRRPQLADAGEMFVGFYVERGVGADVPDAGYYTEDYVITPEWDWHRIIRNMSLGSFAQSIREASERTAGPIDIRVDAHTMVVKATKPPPHDILAFESVDGTHITPSASRSPTFATEQRILLGASTARTLPELSNALLQSPDSNWTWINLHIGRVLRIAATEDVTVTSPAQLIENLVQPLGRWLD